MTITQQLVPNEKNPRKITEERLDELRKSINQFGDLSGIVINRRTGNLIGGHQRKKALKLTEDKITITTQAAGRELLDDSGTVALGYVEVDEEKFAVRIVDWAPQDELAAMVAANGHGGEWERDTLKELFQDLSEVRDLELTLSGFTQAEIDRLTNTKKPLELTGGESKGTPEPEESEDVPTGKHVRIIQLFLTTDNHAEVMAHVKTVSARHNCKNTTEAVIAAIEKQFEKIGSTK